MSRGGRTGTGSGATWRWNERGVEAQMLERRLVVNSAQERKLEQRRRFAPRSPITS